MAESAVLQVKLSGQALSFLRSMVERGDAESEGDVIAEWIELEAAEQERFERDEVKAAYEESLGASESASPIDEVWRNLGLPSREHLKAG